MLSNLEHQQACGDHQRLRHFGLREFFYSQIRAHIVPQSCPRRPDEAPPWSSASTFLRGTAYAAPTVLSLILLVLLVLLLGTHHDLRRLRTSVDQCGAPGPVWAANGAVLPPVTVTATVVSRPTGTPGADGEWDSDLASVSATVSGASPARSIPMSVTMIDISSPPLAKHDRAPPPSGDRSAHGEHNALLPIERLPLLWPIRFEFPFTREQALEVVEHGLGVAWQILRRLYHFPLDPP